MKRSAAKKERDVPKQTNKRVQVKSTNERKHQWKINIKTKELHTNNRKAAFAAK